LFLGLMNICQKMKEMTECESPYFYQVPTPARFNKTNPRLFISASSESHLQSNITPICFEGINPINEFVPAIAPCGYLYDTIVGAIEGRNCRFKFIRKDTISNQHFISCLFGQPRRW
jgi:hypothetical protein